MNCSSPSHYYHKKCSIFSWFVIQAFAITIQHFPTCDAHSRSFRRHTPSRARAQRERESFTTLRTNRIIQERPLRRDYAGTERHPDTTGNYSRMGKQEVHIMNPNLTITTRWNVGTTTSRSTLFRPTLHFLSPFCVITQYGRCSGMHVEIQNDVVLFFLFSLICFLFGFNNILKSKMVFKRRYWRQKNYHYK
jgi:hypothetical protein